jgi:hypothetical protein
MRAESSTGVAARLVNREAGFWRDGVIVQDAREDQGYIGFRHGRAGVMAEFPFTQIPTTEWLAGTGDTAQRMFWDLVRV